MTRLVFYLFNVEAVINNVIWKKWNILEMYLRRKYQVSFKYLLNFTYLNFTRQTTKMFLRSNFHQSINIISSLELFVLKFFFIFFQIHLMATINFQSTAKCFPNGYFVYEKVYCTYLLIFFFFKPPLHYKI